MFIHGMYIMNHNLKDYLKKDGNRLCRNGGNIYHDFTLYSSYVYDQSGCKYTKK